MDDVEPLSPHERGEPRAEDGVEQESGRVRSGTPREPAAVGDEPDDVAAASEPVRDVAHQHLRAAERRIRTAHDERHPHQRVASTYPSAARRAATSVAAASSSAPTAADA